MATAPPLTRRRLSSRRGSASALDPFGILVENETIRGAASRITIVGVPPPSVPDVQHHTRRSSWGPNSPQGASARAGINSTPPGRLSFAFSSFGGGRPQTPPSPGLQRSNSSQAMAGRVPSLTPQQICDLAAATIKSSTSTNNTQKDAPTHTPFLMLPEDQYLPFLDRPTEVTALLNSPPNSRLFALLAQTFPPHQREPYDPQKLPPKRPEDPKRWSFAQLSVWLMTIDRKEADDKLWTSHARTCILSRSELIWSRMKGALGVPPELDEQEDDNEDDFEHAVDVELEGDEDEDEDEGPKEDAWLEPILPGEAPVLISSPASLVPPPDNAFGFGGRDGGMENIGESEREEEESPTPNEGENKDFAEEKKAEPINGLRLCTSVVEIIPPPRVLSRPPSPTTHRRSLSFGAHSSAAPTILPPIPRAGAMRPRTSSSSNSGTVLTGGLHRVRRSIQQERGTGDPLFPTSFAALTMGPSLVANNPALRSGPARSMHTRFSAGPRVRRPSAGTDGDDYAVSLGSGSERSFAG